MDVNMTAEVTGQGLTMEALAQAWDTLNDREVPPDAFLKVVHFNGGRWAIKATWTPAEPATDEDDAQEADAAGLPIMDAVIERQDAFGNYHLRGTLPAVVADMAAGVRGGLFIDGGRRPTPAEREAGIQHDGDAPWPISQ